LARKHTEEHAGGEELLERLAAIAVELSDADTVEETLQLVVDLGQELLAGCDGVSLMLIGKGGRIETPAFSTQVARDSDMVQFETGEGPCLDATRTTAPSSWTTSRPTNGGPTTGPVPWSSASVP
jgi:hypothetical protein